MLRKLNTCGCLLADPVETEIVEEKIFIQKVSLPNTSDNTNCLKEKVVSDFLGIIQKLECGILPDLETLLLEISLIDMKNNWNFSVTKEVYSTSENDNILLRKNNYLSEFSTKDEKDKVINNLGLDGTKHVVLSKREFDTLDSYEDGVVYLITK